MLSFLARVLARTIPVRKPAVTGLWYSVFWYKGVDGLTRRRTHLIRFVSFGERVVGETVAGAGHPFRISAARKAATCLTGSWSHTAGQNIYHGALHFIIEPEGESMHGGWLGFTKAQTIGVGPWAIVKIREEDSGRDALIKRYTVHKAGSLEVHDELQEQSVREVMIRGGIGDVNTSWEPRRTP